MAINYVAVLVAGIAAMALGSVWYGPLFGKRWMKLMGFNEKSMKSMKMSVTKSMSFGFLSALVTAGVLAVLLDYAAASTITASLTIGAWVWLGFLATKGLGAVLWENKSWGLFFLNTSYDLVNILMIAAILSALA